MISYLSGKIVIKKDSFIIIEVQGVGYEVWLSASAMENIAQVGGEIKLFCHLDVQERGLKLYGFLNFEELEFFKIVRNIQGVGPKAALEISGIGPLEKIQAEIKKGNLKFLDGITGIGPKKAAKIILELSGQIKTNLGGKKKEKDTMEAEEAFLALANLGFPKEKIREALAGLVKEMPIQEKISQALKILGKWIKKKVVIL